jgi:flagellar motor switch protein FliN/FliY
VVRGLVETHSWDPAPADSSPVTSRSNGPSAHAEGIEANDENAEKSSMSQSTNPNPTLEVLDEAAVVVRVELGAVEMSAREWAELGNGDVVTLGRKLGTPAVLRVGGVEVARGELVQVDGEYAVRILSRTGDGR